ncbi:MAG: hypothetical protein Ta2A_07610 [Treponemataceae bacterium]|nr:MAG: hypothetical protein Ta2A_07610 [Treponemataceae bacterium]
MQSNTQTKQATQSQYYSVKELSAIFSLSKATVSQAIKAGRIPCIRVSKYPLIPRVWVEQQHQTALASVGGAQ